jgi:hypothetical protein
MDNDKTLLENALKEIGSKKDEFSDFRFIKYKAFNYNPKKDKVVMINEEEFYSTPNRKFTIIASCNLPVMDDVTKQVIKGVRFNHIVLGRFILE